MDTSQDSAAFGLLPDREAADTAKANPATAGSCAGVTGAVHSGYEPDRSQKGCTSGSAMLSFLPTRQSTESPVTPMPSRAVLRMQIEPNPPVVNRSTHAKVKRSR